MNFSFVGWPMRRAGAVVLAALLAACAGGAPDRYYTLSPSGPQAWSVGQGGSVPAAEPVSGSAAGAAPTLAVELGPVSVPERLARPQMVLRREGMPASELQVLEQHRWAASFEQELRDALASGVAQRLGAVDVSRAGRAQGQSVWRISLQLQRFDMAEGQQITSRWQWRVRKPDGQEAGACTWSVSEPLTASGVDAVAQGAQRLTARVAERLSGQIRALQGGEALNCVG